MVCCVVFESKARPVWMVENETNFVTNRVGRGNETLWKCFVWLPIGKIFIITNKLRFSDNLYIVLSGIILISYCIGKVTFSSLQIFCRVKIMSQHLI